MILAAVIIPVVSKSKYQALETTEISNLRQIGLAGSLYRDEYGVNQLLDLAPLVHTGVLDPKLLSTAADPTALGYHHEYRDRDILSEVAPGNKKGALWGYRVSFATPVGTYGVPEKRYARWLTDDPTAGWVVSLSRALRDGCAIDGDRNEAGRTCGAYLRPTNDGSVLFRHSRDYMVTYENGDVYWVTDHLFTFTDRAEQWVKEYRITPPF